MSSTALINIINAWLKFAKADKRDRYFMMRHDILVAQNTFRAERKAMLQSGMKEHHKIIMDEAYQLHIDKCMVELFLLDVKFEFDIS